MSGHITGIYFNVIKKAFSKTVGDEAVLLLCREIGIPDTIGDNDQYSIVDYNLLMDGGIKRFWPDKTRLTAPAPYRPSRRLCRYRGAHSSCLPSRRGFGIRLPGALAT